MQDEVHRYAITTHIKKRNKSMFNSIYSLIMIFVLGFWGYSLYKSYKNPFTWKLFFIHVAGVLAFIIIVPRVVKIMVSSETYSDKYVLNMKSMDSIDDETLRPLTA